MNCKNKDKMRVRLAAAFITTEEPPASDPPASDPPADDPPASDPPADDLTTLFTPEEVAAKKEAITAAKAEEDRRAALSDEERTAEDAEKAAELAKGQAPEKYEFTAPEGITLDADMLGKLEGIAKGANLPQAQAQELVNLGAELVQKIEAQAVEAWDAKRAGWLAESQADKEIGEDVKKGADSATARAFSTIATPEMKTLMEELGIGDHPEVLRMFYRLSQKMREDTFENPGPGANLGGKGAKETVGSMFNHPSRQQG